MIAGIIGNSTVFEPSPLSRLAPQGPDITFSLISTPDQFDKASNALDSFFLEHADGHQAFQCPQLLRAWCRYYLPQSASELAIVVGRRNDKPVLYVPLVRTFKFGIGVLQWAGLPIAQYGDAVVSAQVNATEVACAALKFAAKATGADLFHLRKVRADAAVTNALAKAGVPSTNETEAPFVDLNSYSDDEQYYRRYSSNKRKQRRRRHRQLDEQGKVVFECLSAGNQAAEHAASAIQTKREALGLGARVSAVDSQFENFFVDYCTGARSSVVPRVSVLRSGEQVIAREIGLAFKTHYFAHVGTFDDDYRRFAPGTLQMDRTILQCLSEGLQTYDMLAPDDAYKTDFADGTIAVKDYTLPCTRKGALYGRVVLQETMPRLRQIRDRAMGKG